MSQATQGTLDKALYQFDAKLSLGKALPLALQHVVAMIAGCITPALIVSGAAGLEPQDKVLLIQMSLIMAGLATIVQLFPLFGRIGSKLPVIIGVSFAYVPTMAAVAAQYKGLEGFGPKEAIAVILGAQIIGGVVAVFFGTFIRFLMPLFPAIVTGTVVFVIGLSLYPIAMRYMGGAGNVSIPGWGGWKNWVVAILTFLCGFILNNFGKGLLKQASVLFAMIFGYLIAIPFGMVSVANVGKAAWVAVAPPMHFGLRFEIPVIISFVILFIVNSIQAIGDFSSTTIGGMDRVPTEKELQGGVTAYGFTNIFGAFFGCLPFATFSQNVGIVAVNKVINRLVFLVAAICISVAGFLPKISAALTTIPYPVIGGATLAVFAIITMNGLRLIAKQPLTFRNTTIVGLSVAFGVGFTTVVAEKAAANKLLIATGKEAVEWIPQWLHTAIGTSPVVLATLIAIVLNLVLRAKPEDLPADER